MKKTSELDVRGTVVRVVKINGEDFVCLTDMAKLKSEGLPHPLILLLR